MVAVLGLLRLLLGVDSDVDLDVGLAGQAHAVVVVPVAAVRCFVVALSIVQTGLTPFMVAAFNHGPDTAKLLLSRRADPYRTLVRLPASR